MILVLTGCATPESKTISDVNTLAQEPIHEEYVSEEEIDILYWEECHPVAVFGTLREGRSNHGRIKPYTKKVDGTLDNFYVRGLNIYYREGAAADCEIYFHREEDWDGVLRSLDRLEGFQPGKKSHYHRTLMWLKTDEGLLPCWIYSTMAENRKCPGFPLIWYGNIP